MSDFARLLEAEIPRLRRYGGLLLQCLVAFRMVLVPFGSAFIELPLEFRVGTLQIDYRVVDRCGHLVIPSGRDPVTIGGSLSPLAAESSAVIRSTGRVSRAQVNDRFRGIGPYTVGTSGTAESRPGGDLRDSREHRPPVGGPAVVRRIGTG
jgi:hypothetical protein